MKFLMKVQQREMIGQLKCFNQLIDPIQFSQVLHSTTFAKPASVLPTSINAMLKLNTQ